MRGDIGRDDTHRWDRAGPDDEEWNMSGFENRVRDKVEDRSESAGQ